MGSRQALVQGAPPGAGRGLELRWPDYGTVPNDNSNPGAGSTGRGGGASSAGWTIHTAATGTVRYKNNEPGVGAGPAVGPGGAVCAEFANAAGGDLANVQGPAAMGQLAQLPAGIVSDPFERVFRFVAFAAFPPLGGAIGAAADLGLEIVPGNVASMNQGANRPGIMFGPTDVNKIGLRTRDGFAAPYKTDQEFTLAQLGLASYNQWMLWELRIVFGDANGPAQLKAFLNNRQFGNTVVWGAAAGSLLPTYIGAGGGFMGLYPYFVNVNNGGLATYAQWLRVIRAPDESNL